MRKIYSLMMMKLILARKHWVHWSSKFKKTWKCSNPSSKISWGEKHKLPINIFQFNQEKSKSWQQKILFHLLLHLFPAIFHTHTHSAASTFLVSESVKISSTWLKFFASCGGFSEAFSLPRSTFYGLRMWYEIFINFIYAFHSLLFNYCNILISLHHIQLPENFLIAKASFPTHFILLVLLPPLSYLSRAELIRKTWRHLILSLGRSLFVIFMKCWC